VINLVADECESRSNRANLSGGISGHINRNENLIGGGMFNFFDGDILVSSVRFDHLFLVLEKLLLGEVVRLVVLVDRFERKSVGEKVVVTVWIEGLGVCDPFARNGNLRGFGIGHGGEIE